MLAVNQRKGILIADTLGGKISEKISEDCAGLCLSDSAMTSDPRYLGCSKLLRDYMRFDNYFSRHGYEIVIVLLGNLAPSRYIQMPGVLLNILIYDSRNANCWSIAKKSKYPTVVEDLDPIFVSIMIGCPRGFFGEYVPEDEFAQYVAEKIDIIIRENR